MSSERDATTGAAGDVSRRRALATVLGIVFIDLLGFGVIIPVLPFYVRSFGVSDVFIGLLAASYSLTQFVFAPLLGRLSDERGRRPVLMLSVFGSAVAWTLFGLGEEFQVLFGTVGGLGVLFAARMLAGAMGGNIATAQAYITDVTPKEDRAAALGLIGATFGLGFVFGPALGSVVASDSVVTAARNILPSFVPATTFSLPSFLAAGLSLLAFVAAALFLPEPNRTRTTRAESGLVSQFRTALADADLRPLVLVFLVVSLAFSGVQVAFIPFVADIYGYQEAQAGLLLTYIGVLGVLNQGVVVRALSRRFADERLAVGGASLLLVSLVLLPFAPILGRALFPAVLGASPELVALLVVLAILSSGNGLLNVGTASMVSAAADEDSQGSAFGVTQGAGSLGRTIGPPVMTAIYVLVYWAPFLLGATLTAFVVAALVVLVRRSEVFTDV
ncbi:MFS transporter [Salinibaculum rarum]|uniref:MFS transporter n=1 Tax=Salinibaculum rarum TaxID=3058903 RepID=UPI00265EDF7A|nr:MFS transporter [Salinibaculum sp. KK48]